ncbi:MAG: alpha-mannosidase [Anaerolineae bacterium]|nr:alpha-mannosidase [Anaerolineae bacterium]
MTSFLTQFTDLSQSLAYSAQRRANRLERFTAQLHFAQKLAAIHPDQAPAWQALILEAGRLVQEGLAAARLDLDDLVARGEAILAPIGQAAKTYTLLCVSHAHIDMNWMWSWPETVAVAHDTFQTMLALLDEFPQFIYSQSQASTYRLIEQYNPAMFERIRRRIHEGRWEVTASQWVEGDKNMASGESISRHLLYTRAYMWEKFGLRPEDIEVDFEPDTFGHPATLPGILVRGGVRYYYHCRGSHGPHLYWWVGPDGSRLLTFTDVKWYMCAIGPQIAAALPEFVLSTGMNAMPVLYGVGDHGGGPTRRDLRRIQEMNGWPVFPTLAFSTLHHFFRRAEKEATNVPEVGGERNFVFTGCYTSQARQKAANRYGESLLFAAEAAATIGSRLAGVPYPSANLEEAWKRLLFSQFHDILPGSGVRETRHYTLGQAQESQAAAGMARSNGLRALGERIDTASLRAGFARRAEDAYKDAVESDLSLGAGVGYAAGSGGESAVSVTRAGERAFLIFNPLPVSHRRVVEAKLWDVTLDEQQWVVTSDGLAPRPVQVLDKGKYWGHEFVTIAFPVEAPALGYRVVCISDRLAELAGSVEPGLPDPWAGTGGSWRQVQRPDYTLENEFLKVRLDPASGGLVSLLDKRSGREWVPEGELTGVLQYCVERNEGMTAWVIGQFLTQQDLLDGGALTRMHDGSYVQRWRWSRRLGASKLELEISLCQGAPRLDYKLRVDWREMGDPERGIPNLRVRFPLAVAQPQTRAYPHLRCEIPFGSIGRQPTDQVVAQRWVDLSEEDGAGVTLVNSSRYGFGLEAQAVSMTLLRASIDPDPLPDLGEHVIEYALLPHLAGWTEGQAMRAGEEMNIPLAVSSCGFHDGDLPAVKAFLELGQDNVRLAAVKESQEKDGGQGGNALILRLVEVEGRDTQAGLLIAPELLPPDAEAIEVDTLERPIAGSTRVRLEGDVLRVKMPAFGIVTVRIV